MTEPLQITRMVEAYNNRGSIRFIRGEITEALVDLTTNDFNQCFKLNPDLRPLIERQIQEVKQLKKRTGGERQKS